jgi:hypothetical protein
MNAMPYRSRSRPATGACLAWLMLALLVARLGHGLLHQGHGESSARGDGQPRWQVAAHQVLPGHGACAFCTNPAHGVVPHLAAGTAFTPGEPLAPRLAAGRPYLPWLLALGQAAPRAPPPSA